MKDSVDIAKKLFIKSKESLKAAEELEELGLKNSAVNRYYYSLYQLIIPHVNVKDVKNALGFGLHEKTINAFFTQESEHKDNTTGKDEFHLLRTHRNEADYTEKSISDNDFETFKDDFCLVKKSLYEIEKIKILFENKRGEEY